MANEPDISDVWIAVSSIESKLQERQNAAHRRAWIGAGILLGSVVGVAISLIFFPEAVSGFIVSGAIGLLAIFS